MELLPTVTYRDYQDGGGLLDKDDFLASRPAAVAAVRYVIGFNVPDTDYQIAAYKRAVCAAVNVDYTLGRTGGVGPDMSSISIGSFSATAADGSADDSRKAYDVEMDRVIRHELVATGLLYQGIG